MLQRQPNKTGNSIDTTCTNDTNSRAAIRKPNSRTARSRSSQQSYCQRCLFVVALVTSITLLQYHYSSVVFGSQYDVELATTITTTTGSTQMSLEGDRRPIHSFRRAVFLISMGKDAAESGIVERCITSIRRRGSWKGPVILLTDATTERYKSLYIEETINTAANNDNVNKNSNLNELFFVLQPMNEHYDWDAHTMKQDMIYKRFKTFILDYVDKIPILDHIELIYYLDIDIVVGAPLLTFFDFTESKYNIQCCTDIQKTKVKLSKSNNHVGAGNNPPIIPLSKLYLYRGNFPLPVQSGQLILERHNTRHCLERWRSWIDRDPELILDQLALKNLLNETLKEQEEDRMERGREIITNDRIDGNSKFYPCKIIIMEQEPHLHFPTKPTMVEMLKTEKFPTLIHVKNSKTAGQIPWRVQKDFYRSVLQLSPTEEEEGMQFVPDLSSTNSTSTVSSTSRKKIARPFVFQASKEWSKVQQQQQHQPV